MGGFFINKDKNGEEQTINKLMEAAYLVFSKKGYERTTVDDISFAAGFTKGAFYWNFSSKEDLFLKMIEFRVKSQRSFFLSKLRTYESELQIKTMFQEMVSEIQQDCWIPMFIEFLAHASRNENVKQKMAEMYLSWRTFLINILEEAKRNNFISPQLDSRATAAVVIALFDGFNMQNLVDNEVISIDEIVTALNKILD